MTQQVVMTLRDDHCVDDTTSRDDTTRCDDLLRRMTRLVVMTICD
jgi:hypothetical protein